MPLRSLAPKSLSSKRLPRSLRVASAITTVFGSAIPCRRAARFGVSPTMPRSCASPDPIRSPTTTSPVAMPTRVCNEAGVLKCDHRRDQLEPGTHRPLGVILMGLGVAKVDKHAVPHIARHETAEAAHGFNGAFLIGRDELSQVLRIHPSGECGRTNEVREHHRDLPALGGVLSLRLCFDSGGFTCYRDGAGQLTDGREHFAPMPKQHTDVLEILIGQITQYRDIDPVFGKARGVLGQAELLEPVSDLLHCSGSPSAYGPGNAMRRTSVGC